MKICIVFHSETGNTKKVAMHLASATGARLVPVKDCACYNNTTIYTLGALRARRREKATIEPEEIDVSDCDMVVMGSPVWAWHPTPAANAAITALQGCRGKKGIVFATSSGKPGETLVLLARALEERGVHVVGRVLFTSEELESAEKFTEFLDLIQKFGSSSAA
jgi:flavorubredoxin